MLKAFNFFLTDFLLLRLTVVWHL